MTSTHVRKFAAALAASFATVALMGGCGGGGGSTATQVVAAPTNNVAAITVDGGPAHIVDIPFISVTLCAPGSTTQCQTIDHVEVDTGSSGLRILSSVLQTTLNLPQESAANGHALVECAQFADGYSWGPVKTADLTVSGETAASIPVQIIGDANYTAVPADCSSSGPEEDTVDAFGANGILGVGPFMEDCGAACASSIIAGVYYACATASTCTSTTVARAQQVVNPVTRFATDNNGVIVELAAVGSGGTSSPTGSLVFGIGTQSNNGLGGARVYAVSSSTGTLSATYKNVTYANSFIDSGSSAYYFVDNSIATCDDNNQTAPGFYCPASTVNLSVTLNGRNGADNTIDFSIADAETLLRSNASATAFSNIGAPSSDHTSFDFGLPFFFGRNVYTAIEGANTSGGIGPFYAF